MRNCILLYVTLGLLDLVLPFDVHRPVLSMELELLSFNLQTIHHFSAVIVYTVTRMTLKGG